MINEKKFQINKTARYYILGEINSNIKSIWYVLHGYGQLAKEFITKFEIVKNDEILIVAPEALNKFYFRGLSGNIGASWMTKEDRENEIDDYINFLKTVNNMVMEEFNSSKISINILGFSQGCHTAVRWLDREKLNIKKLIMWSGSFPDDVNYSFSSEYWKNINIKTVLGNKDRLIDKSIIVDQHKKLEKLKIKIKLLNFNGGHKIDPNVLKSLIY